MNLTIIAEGIETSEQYDFLKKEGCDQGQVYLMGRSMPVDALPALLDSVLVDDSEILTRIIQKSKDS